MDDAERPITEHANRSTQSDSQPKGQHPHIVVVTFEPLPTRVASIALGAGDVDCTDHAALDELIEAARETGRIDQLELLQDLINGQRLRDISDLPLDLAVSATDRRRRSQSGYTRKTGVS